MRLIRSFPTLLGALALLNACVLAGDGLSPPAEKIYFPVGLSVTGSGAHLVVVNSNFDLQYSQGTIQTLDMTRIYEVAVVPCSGDQDCEDSEICDLVPSEANGRRPSSFCVDASDPRPCGRLGEKTESERAVAPGRCRAIDLEFPQDGKGPLLVDIAETAAFATQGLLLQRPCTDDGETIRPCTEADSLDLRIEDETRGNHAERLFVPLRGNTSMQFLDLTPEGTFVCGREIERSGHTFRYPHGVEALRCGSNYQVSLGTTFELSSDGELVTTQEPPDPLFDEDEPEEDNPLEDFRLQPEPFDLTATRDGRVILVSHQVNGRATTLINSWLTDPSIVVTTENLPERPIGVAALPSATDFNTDSTSEVTGPGFLIAYRSEARVDLMRFLDDGLLEAMAPGGLSEDTSLRVGEAFRPLLSMVASTPVTLNSLGTDNRGVAVDDSKRLLAVTACSGDETCLAVARETPLDVYVANRTPNSLLVGKTGGADVDLFSSELPSFHANIPLTAGPSRVVLGSVTDLQGNKQLRVFVICFDSSLIYVYHPELRAVEAVIRTGRGPHSIAFDPQSSLAFVGHFTDSYVGVVSLDQRHPRSFGAFVATLGIPDAPRASK